MAEYTDRHLFALGHPCYLPEETAQPQYGDRPAPNIRRVLTVNSGFE